MNYITNKKGQGSDTFKLLIAAVVAMVILGIVTGVFQNIWDLVTGITCVSNPINEMMTKMQKSQAGITTSTDAICMNAGEAFSAKALTDKVTNVMGVTFSCKDNVAVCKTGGAILVTDDMISASASAKFKALITCDRDPGPDFDCEISVISA